MRCTHPTKNKSSKSTTETLEKCMKHPSRLYIFLKFYIYMKVEEK